MNAGKARTTPRFLHALASVIAGNALYFLVAAPHLPEAARHTPFAFDLGLVIDFAICAATYAALAVSADRRNQR